MKSYDVSECIAEFMRHRDLVDSDYLLYASGRALGWLKMSADAIDDLPNELKLAEYHAYAGISAARTAIDALSNWLNAELGLGRQGIKVDLKKEDFRKRVREKAPAVAGQAERLGDMAAEVDEYRQRAQHREGLALRHYQPGGWHLTQGLQASPDKDVPLPGLVRHWADSIESQICEVVRGIAR